MENFELDQVQATAVIEMRLQRLTGLELEKILEEIKENPTHYSGIGENADQNIKITGGTIAVSGGALAAVLGLTAGVVVTGSAVSAGTGLAGLLGSGALAGWCAALGWGTAASTVVTTAPFWGIGLGPFIAIVIPLVAALALFGTVVAKGFFRKKIVEKVKEELTKQIVGDDDSSVLSKLTSRVGKFVKGAVTEYRNNLDTYLNNLDKQEKKIIADVAKAKGDKERTIKTVEAFRMEVKAFVESSVQSLRELNPGKEPVHG